MVRSYQYDNRQCIGNTRMTPAKPQKCWENAVQHPCVGCITPASGVRPSPAARLPAAPVDPDRRGSPRQGSRA